MSTFIGTNKIFGYRIASGNDSLSNIGFDGTHAIESPTGRRSWQVKLFASPEAHLTIGLSDEKGFCAYVWGIPVHPKVGSADIPSWCANIVAERHYNRFKELLGPFVVIVDEPAQHRITIATDIQGIRPIFLTKDNGRIVFGSDVWSIQKAGLINKAVDYDAVSAWITYGYNCTNGTLFAGLRRLPPGSVTVLQRNQCDEFRYAVFQAEGQRASVKQAAADLHQIVASTVKTLLENYPRVTLALSGGYDSRYLLALSSLFLREAVNCAVVSVSEEEITPARQVAVALGASLDIIRVKGSEWDLYDQVYHFTPDGFPISKFVTYCMAQKYPATPMINGFLGDSLMRGSHDRIHEKYETGYGDNLADVLQREHTIISPDVFRRDVVAKIEARSRLPMETAVREGQRIGKVFNWADLFYRQRFYISNNFLQHISLTEGLLPFYSWELLSYKMNHDNRVFSREIYDMIFAGHFASIAKIPHASDLAQGKSQTPKPARCTKRWARQLLPKIANKNWLSLLAKRRSSLLAVAGMVNSSRFESSILTLQRLYLLEERARSSAIDFDWERL